MRYLPYKHESMVKVIIGGDAKMIFYHVSDSNLVGKVRTPNYLNLKRFISPFVTACYAGEDVFIATVIAARYSDERVSGMIPSAGSIHQKMACEGVFEYVRCLEYSNHTPRYNAVYLFKTKADCIDFINKYQNNKHIYKVIIDSEPVRYDMNLFNIANNLISVIYNKNDNNYQKVIELARAYWKGQSSANPVYEYLCDKSIILLEDKE